MVRVLTSIAIVALTLLPAVAYADRAFSWDEEVLLSDGSRVWMRRDVRQQKLCHSALPGSCTILRSELKTVIPGIGTIQFKWEGRELPVTFDVVDGRPWIVLPILEIERCEQYGNPAESVASFAWDKGAWHVRPYGEVMGRLKLNLIRRLPSSSDPQKLTVEAKYRDRQMGVELDKSFIPQHANWSHACHKLNPPPTPEHERVMNDYRQGKRSALTGKIVETREDEVALTQEQDRAMMGHAASRLVSGCEGKVRHVDTAWQTLRIPNGGSRSSHLPYRIALAEGAASAHLYLPRGPELARVACSDTHIYVVVRDSTNQYDVVAYDLGGNQSDAWRLRIPELDQRQYGRAHVLQFHHQGDRFSMVIGQYRRLGADRAPAIATLGKRVVVNLSSP